ncbi:MAG: hypothetical protein ACK4HB_01350 [Candidatus Bipolaricaulia bacterium]
MSSMKRTYALPADLLEQFEREVESGRRSRVIAELLRQWLDERRRQQLRAGVIEGCHTMAKVMLEIEREFRPLDEEIDRALENAPETR